MWAIARTQKQRDKGKMIIATILLVSRDHEEQQAGEYYEKDRAGRHETSDE